MTQTHGFEVAVTWVGDRGTGTSGWRDYGREVELSAPGHPVLAGSAARAFHGDPERWNPEELMLAALAQCHLLAYLRDATLAGVVVVGYRDEPSLVLRTHGDVGEIAEAVLRPRVVIADGDLDLAAALHETAAAKCFVARSVAFPVRHEPVVRRASALSGPYSALA